MEISATILTVPFIDKNLLKRLKDTAIERVQERVKNELSPEINPAIPGTDVPMPDQAPQGLRDRIKQTVRDKVQQLSPIQKRMLDPAAALDEPTIRYRIRYAGQNHLLLLMTYNNQSRHVEPYSYRHRAKDGGVLFFGFCRPHGKIHAFDLSKIQSLQVTNIPFNPNPDWPIEV